MFWASQRIAALKELIHAVLFRWKIEQAHKNWESKTSGWQWSAELQNSGGVWDFVAIFTYTFLRVRR
jgi:hypothetical protein